MSLAVEPLGNHLDRLGERDEQQARVIFRGIAHGMEYIHSLHVAHRDLKCENILLDRYNHVKIADFGCAHISDKIGALTALQVMLKTLQCS
jgi:serine/threonine protein kinase